MVFGLAAVLWILATPVALLLAALSPMLGDDPTNAANPRLPLILTLLYTWPAATLLAPVGGAIAWRKGRRQLAWGLLASPLLWVAAVFIVGSPFDAR
jgi:hypothetical protein